MLKETETEETTVFFVTFFSSVAFQLGGGVGLATPMIFIMLSIAATVEGRLGLPTSFDRVGYRLLPMEISSSCH